MELPVDILEKIDIVNLLAMGALLWVFYNRLDKKMDQRFEKVEEKIDKLDTRISRLEGDMIEVKTVLRLKECCVIKDDSQLKKAE